MNITKEILEIIKNNISDGVIGIDNNKKIFFINDHARKFLNLDTDVLYYNVEDVDIIKNILSIYKGVNNHCIHHFESNDKLLDICLYSLTTLDNSGYLLIVKDITESEMQLEEEYNLENITKLMNLTNDWSVIVDSNGLITMMSEKYKEFVGKKDVIGKHVTDVIKNTRLHEILVTGEREIGEIQEINGNKMISMRIPIKKDNKVVGAIGKVMFKDINDFYALSKKIHTLNEEIEYYKDRLIEDDNKDFLDTIIGTSDEIKKLKSIVKKTSRTDSSVLITGESGTGKEIFAEGIHRSSKRRKGPFIKINCAAIPYELLESELFGYAKGAFTGANVKGKIGKFELADKGSILLDEIGDMPLNMQVKILRVLQEKEFEKIGSNKTIKVDVRIIASTNKNLEEMVRNKEFREDLYYRLNVIKLELPPLRERTEDIESLTNHLRKKISSRIGFYVEGIDKKALGLLKAYDWPGNVRELENVLERAINLIDSDLIIKSEHLPEKIRNNEHKLEIEDKKLEDYISEIEIKIIQKYLRENNGNKKIVAKKLHISRTNLYNKMKKYNIGDIKG